MSLKMEVSYKNVQLYPSNLLIFSEYFKLLVPEAFEKAEE